MELVIFSPIRHLIECTSAIFRSSTPIKHVLARTSKKKKICLIVFFEGVRVPLIPDDPSRECIAVLLPKPRRAGTRSLGRQERT